MLGSLIYATFSGLQGHVLNCWCQHSRDLHKLCRCTGTETLDYTVQSSLSSFIFFCFFCTLFCVCAMQSHNLCTQGFTRQRIPWNCVIANMYIFCDCYQAMTAEWCALRSKYLSLLYHFTLCLSMHIVYILKTAILSLFFQCVQKKQFNEPHCLFFTFFLI